MEVALHYLVRVEMFEFFLDVMHCEHPWTLLTFCRSCLATVSFGALLFILPREKPVDEDGKVDFIGALLGLSGLLLFSVAWK